MGPSPLELMTEGGILIGERLIAAEASIALAPSPSSIGGHARAIEGILLIGQGKS